MTRQEAIKETEYVIATIQSYKLRVEQIPGSDRNRACDRYIGKCKQYISI